MLLKNINLNMIVCIWSMKWVDWKMRKLVNNAFLNFFLWLLYLKLQDNLLKLTVLRICFDLLYSICHFLMLYIYVCVCVCVCVCVYIYFFLLGLCHCVACRILVPQPGIEPGPLAVRALSPNHWATREFPNFLIYLCLMSMKHRK